MPLDDSDPTLTRCTIHAVHDLLLLTPSQWATVNTLTLSNCGLKGHHVDRLVKHLNASADRAELESECRRDGRHWQSGAAQHC